LFELDFGNLRTVSLVCLLWKCFSHFDMVNKKSSLPYIQSTVRLPLIDGFTVREMSPSDNTASCLRSVFTHVHISLQINVLLRFSGQHLHIFDWHLCLRCWVPSSSMFAPFSSSLDTLRLHKVQLRLLIGMFCSRDHCARPGWFPGLLDTLDYVGLKHFWKFEVLVVWYSMIMYASTALLVSTWAIWNGLQTHSAESLEPMLHRSFLWQARPLLQGPGLQWPDSWLQRCSYNKWSNIQTGMTWHDNTGQNQGTPLKSG
jgi:hypothetical protein